MGITIMGAVVTLDGYIADVNGEVGSLFDQATLSLCRTPPAWAQGDRVTHLLYEVEGTTRRNERDRAPGRA
jgi:hypothetical protein